MSACANIQLSGTSPAAPGTLAGTTAAVTATDALSQPLSGYDTMRIEATVQGATGGTLDVYLQVSYDGGVSWSDYAHFTQLAAGGAAVTYGVSVTRAKGDALGTIGKNTTPAIAANAARDGEWGDRMRMLFVAGAGTSAGATQIVKLFLSKSS